MKQDEFDRLLNEGLQKYGATVEPIPPKKESSGTRKVQFFMVNHPRSQTTPAQTTSPSKSCDTPADD